MSQLYINPERLIAYPDIYTDLALQALEVMAPFNQQQKILMEKRNQRRNRRITQQEIPNFLQENERIGPQQLLVRDIRAGHFESSRIPDDLKRQWIQGTGPAAKPNVPLASSLRTVAYALLSGADGWMFDGEDALGQTEAMSLDNQRNLKLAVHRDPQFLSVAKEVSKEMNNWSDQFLGRPIVSQWQEQLDFTTLIFRARGLHLDDRHIQLESGEPFSASITDLTLFVVNNYKAIQVSGASIVLYLPKIQTAEEAAFWNTLLSNLETYLGMEKGTIKVYVLIEQLEAAYQLLEIRAALGLHFVGFNTGRWDYINSLSDALSGFDDFIHPNIESITMTYAYMAAYEDRVRRAVNTPDQNGNFSLWQGGMEPNIPVGSLAGIRAGMEKALAGAKREQAAGASGKWVAHWKMVHIIRPIWEEIGEINQSGKKFGPLKYTEEDRMALISLADAPLTIQGARNLLSVALQYGNAFLQGFQAAALKPADFFGNEDILYLMEDMATGEIRLSVLWEWVHKGAHLTENEDSLALQAGDPFNKDLFDQILAEEYQKLQLASDKNVHDDSKTSTLPIALEIVQTYVHSGTKAPWYIDLLNLNLNNNNLEVARQRISKYYELLKNTGQRITENLDFEPNSNIKA